MLVGTDKEYELLQINELWILVDERMLGRYYRGMILLI